MTDRLHGQPDAWSGKRARTVAAAGYLFWPLALYGAFAPPSREGRFVRFHARQALVFGVTMTLVVAVLAFVPLLGAAFAVIVPVPWVAIAVMWAVKAHGGERAEMRVFHSIGAHWIDA